MISIEPRLLALVVLLLAVCVLLYWVMTDKKNSLECWQFIGTRGVDGKHYADLDKLGKLAGIIFGSWSVVKIAYTDGIENNLVAFAMVLSAYFAFVGGVAGYAAYLRSKRIEPEAK